MTQEKKFEINMTKDALTSFVFTSYYSRLGGWFSILLGLAGVGMAVREIFFRDHVDAPSLAAYLIIAVICLLVNPLSLRSKAKKQLETSDSYKKSIEYTLYPEYLEVRQDEEHLEVGWELIYKIKMTKCMVAVYTNKINAFIWPLSELGEEKAAILSRVVQYTQEFHPILSGNLKEYRKNV